MLVSSLPVRLRLGALVLLGSVLLLAVRGPVLPGTGTEVRPAAWLRAQVSSFPAQGNAQLSASQAAFNRALAEAEEAAPPTLHDFLTTFLEAHARRAGLEMVSTEGRTTRALVKVLRKQLQRAGLEVRLPTKASAPPITPRHWARGMISMLLVPVPDRFAVATQTPSLKRALSAVDASVQHIVSSVARGPLVRVLFAGRRLGP